MLYTKELAYAYPESQPIYFPEIKVEAGQSLLISGESGCGKTTLLHMLAGLRRPSAGQVLIDDVHMTGLSSKEIDQFRGRYIGIVYQQPYFIESISVLDNILLSPYATQHNEVEKLASRLHVGKVLSRYPYQLSVGQQQRVTIARAVVNKPKVILADEPTSALDNKNCSAVLDLLLGEAQVNQAALIIVSHDDRLKGELRDSIQLNSIQN